MSSDYYRFMASMEQADRNVLIMFGLVLLALLTYASISWYPIKWQAPARIAAKVFAILSLAAMVGMSL